LFVESGTAFSSFAGSFFTTHVTGNFVTFGASEPGR